LEIDASAFSGGVAGYPERARWADKLIAPLDRTARWLRSRGVSRVSLGGSYRLTTALALGWSFRAANGFELEIPTREGPWLTDDRPAPGDAAPAWWIVDPDVLHGDQLVVAVGVLRDPSADLAETAGVRPAVLSAYLAEPITSGREAQMSASIVKQAVDMATARLRPKGIQMYIAGPAAFAVAFGHRWNAMGPIQLHELVTGKRRYVPTALL